MQAQAVNTYPSSRLRTIIFVIGGIVSIWFLYLEREILTPFILAGIFAYLLNPLVYFLSHTVKIPRIISVVVIFVSMIGLFIGLGVFLERQVTHESTDLKTFINSIIETTKAQVHAGPDWLTLFINDALISIEPNRILSPQSIYVFFPKAISRIVSFVIFLFAGFYFLKDGKTMIDKLLSLVPHYYRIDLEILLRKINSVLGGYLRGQLFLVLFVSSVLFIALTILGIRFALIVAIFSGFAEIVPFIGPIVAGSVAVLVVLATGDANFNLTPLTASLVVGLTYFIVRQIQDYFITPYVMGKITKLHPLVILFSVLAGEHIWGMLGLLLAVPIAATIRILIEFVLDKMYQEKS